MNIDNVAQQIVALINSQPRSPSVDEIKGVLTSHVQEVITGMPPILSEKDLADIAKRMDVSPGGMITLDNRPTAEIMDFWQFQHRIDERCKECRYRRPD